jgi:hypothetical protein
MACISAQQRLGYKLSGRATAGSCKSGDPVLQQESPYIKYSTVKAMGDFKN